MKETSVDTGGVRLNVAEGPKSGPTLVLLHGVTRRWQDFAPLLGMLTPRWSVHAIDMRGHGHSDRAVTYRVADYVPDVVGYLERAAGEPAMLLGHSLGGMVAAGIAASRPDLVRGLVLEDPPFEMMGTRLADTAYPDIFAAYARLAGYAGSVEEAAILLGDAAVRSPSDPMPKLMRELRDEVSLRFAAACLKRVDPAVLSPVVAGNWLEGFHTPAVLAAVKCPALYLQADFEAGGTVPDDYAAELMSNLARGLLVRFPGVGHQIHAMRPVEMMRVVWSFLESLE